VGGESGHQRKPSERGTRTSCRAQERQVRTPKETEQAGDTDFLFGTEGGTIQVTKQNQANEGHSLSDERRGGGGPGQDAGGNRASEGHSPPVMVGSKGRTKGGN